MKRHDLGPPVRRIGDPLDITELLEVVDDLTPHRLLGHARVLSERGEPRSTAAETREHHLVRWQQPGVSARLERAARAALEVARQGLEEDPDAAAIEDRERALDCLGAVPTRRADASGSAMAGDRKAA